jgi:nucleoside-diphosphate-sugar epimerase
MPNLIADINTQPTKLSLPLDRLKIVHTNEDIVGPDDPILITGASGFVGTRVVENLIGRGFRNIRCFVRPSSPTGWLDSLAGRGAKIEVFPGNLLSREDCLAAAKDIAVIYHLAAGRGEKSFPDAFMNSVVTTRNLLEAALASKCLRRFVNISSFTVYNNRQRHGGRLDETCPVETDSVLRGEAYCFGKVKQDELVFDYGKKFNMPYVIVRPGYVIGPGKAAITGRVGIDTFGVFLHMGGSNEIPFTYVENCADAIVLAGLKAGVDGEIFNVVDDDLPSSRRFLRLYKRKVRRFKSVYVPHLASYALCSAWEWYSRWSESQLPPVFNRGRWYANWKRTSYSNQKLKARLGWSPKVSTKDAMNRFFEACRERESHA